MLVAVVMLLAVVAVATTPSRWLGLGSVLAMLVAGIVPGSFGLAIAPNVARVRDFSEFGVVLLMLTIGLEMERGARMAVSAAHGGDAVAGQGVRIHARHRGFDDAHAVARERGGRACERANSRKESVNASPVTRARECFAGPDGR